MTIYFLHLCNGVGYIEDEGGHEFSDLAAARASAVQALRGISAEEVKGGMLYPASFIEIENAEHRHVATVHFSDAVIVSEKIERKPRLI